MRIAVVTWSRRVVGGTEGYLRALLPALAARGHETALVSEMDLPTDRAAITADGTEWCAARSSAAEVIKEVQRWRPDLIYGHGSHDPAFERRLLDLASGVFFVHSYYGICVSGTKTFRLPRTQVCERPFGLGCLACFYPRRCGGLNPLTALRDYRRQAARFENLRRYTRLLTHSAHVAGQYRRNGFVIDPITYVVEEAGAGEPERVTLPERPTVMFAGRMDRLKGVDLLIEAAVLHQQTHPGPLRLLLAGDGPERSALERRARRALRRAAGLAIDLPGWLDPGALASAYAAADVVAVPSIWPEPFGKVGPEAASRGRPLIAFDVGGVREWLQDGINGHLAPAQPPTARGLARALAQCLDDPEHYRDLCRNGPAVVARFRMDNHLADLLPVFNAAAACMRRRSLEVQNS